MGAVEILFIVISYQSKCPFCLDALQLLCILILYENDCCVAIGGGFRYSLTLALVLRPDYLHRHHYMMVVNDHYIAVGGDFRCPPILAIVLRVLSAYIQASRLYLHQQVTANTGVIAAATSTGDAAKVQSSQCSFDGGGGFSK